MKGKKNAVDKRMLENTKSALKEHISGCLKRSSYASLRTIKLPSHCHSLSFWISVDEKQGKRMVMEDASFVVDMDHSLCFGILDGHAGLEVSFYAAKRFKKIFSSYATMPPENVGDVLKDAFFQIQQEVEELYPEWDHIGSTALVSWIDKEKNLIYTATLGDSFASIYRIVKGKWKVIPLSCIRNWSSKRDQASARQALGEEIPQQKSPKLMRHPPPGFSVSSGCGLNVSRALGDVAYKGVIHTPKITVSGVFPEDIIILACDGLRDFVSEEEIIAQIGFCNCFNRLSEQLVNYAIEEKRSSDNVSVIALYASCSS